MIAAEIADTPEESSLARSAFSSAAIFCSTRFTVGLLPQE